MKLLNLTVLLLTNLQLLSQTIEDSYTINVQVPAGTSVFYYVPISGVPSNATISGVEAKFEYIAYNGVEQYLSARFNRGSDPGTSGGVVLVAQGNLPPGSPNTYGYIPFSNWNGNSVNTYYYFRFTVASGSPYNPTIIRIWTKVNYNIPPAAPTLILPSNAANTSQQPFFQWNQIIGQTDFQLLIDPNQNWVTPLRNIPGGSSNSYTELNPLAPGTYFWKMRIATASGISDWSEVRNFNVIPPPQTPIPTRPLANAQVFSSRPTFGWQAVPNQTNYRVVVYNNSSGTNMVLNHSEPSSSNTYTVSLEDALPAGDYWWKVNVANVYGNSPYSDLIHFTVNPPTPISPINTTVGTSTPTFTWAVIPNQTHFQVVIYDDPSGTDPHIIKNYPGTGSNNSWTCDVNLDNDQYWWKVNVAVSTEIGNSPYCGLETFTVQVTQLNLISPTYNGNIYGGDIILQWSDVNADSYHVYVDNNIIPGPPGVYSSPEIYKKKVITNEYTIPEYFLEGDQTFYWRIVAFLPGGTEINSDVSIFNYFPPKEAEPIWTPLYRLYKSADKDHFYCTTPEQRQEAKNVGYLDERIEGHISAKPFNDADMVYIFRLYHPSLLAHYYTANGDDKDIKIQDGYTYEGIIGFAYSSNKPELTPFYQLHKDFTNPTNVDNFYTCSFAERDNAVRIYGFIYDGIIAFLSPSGNNSTLPVGPGQLEAGLGVNTANGNLRHYTKTSFNIPGKGIPLSFEHIYNSNSVWLYAGITPLSPGWSHTYNSYVVTLNPEEVNQNVIVVWPDGNIHEYYYNGTNYSPQTPGDYDIFNVIAAPSHFTVKKKDQTLYTFQTPPSAPGYPAMLTSIKDRNNNTTTLTYEANPIIRLKEVTDPSGRKLTFNYYTESGKEYLIKEVIDNAGSRTIQFIYDSENRLVEFKDAESRNTFYLYDQTWGQYHLLTKISLPKGNVIDFAYVDPENGIGKRVSQQLINGGSQLNYTYNYSTPSATVTDANNIQMRYEYNTDALITNVYDVALSKGDKFWYQDSDNPTKPTQVQDKKGNYSTFQYDLRGNVLQINQIAGITISHKYEYDAMNNITKYTNPRNKITNFVYDGNGNLTSISEPNPRGTTNYGRNVFGKIVSITNPLTHTTNFGYNSYGNLNSIIDPLSNPTSLTYDNISRLISLLNANNQNIIYNYDKTDLLLTITDALNNNTTYSYDANSNLTNILNARGFSTNMGYDDLDRLISKTEPSSNPTQFSYRNNGQLASRTNPDGSLVSYGYDGSGRLTNISTSDVNANLQYDGNGNITGVTESGNYKGGGTLSFSFDDIDRLTSYTDFYSKSVSYTYDESSNIKSITYPGSKTVNYTYNDDNSLSTVTDWNGKTTSYVYRSDGTIHQIYYPNGVVTTYYYDNAERVTGINVTGSAVTIANYSFTLDKIGNHTQETIDQPLNPTPNLSNDAISYSYDPANRIQSAGGTTFNFDQNGNMIQKNSNGLSINYKYDDENRLVKVTKGSDTTEYVYDIFGNRRAVVRNGNVTNYILDINGSMSQVLLETDASGNPINYYVYGLGLVSRIKPDGTTRYYHGDFRGSVIAITDLSGNLTHKYSYESFGNLIDKVEEDTNPFRYVGKYGVIYEDTSLYFMRARYYDPTIGRFLSEDPVWDVNLYSYAGNNPVSKIDPQGKIAWTIGLYYKSIDFIIKHDPKIANWGGNLIYNYLSKDGQYLYTEEGDKTLRRLQKTFEIISYASKLTFSILDLRRAYLEISNLSNPSFFNSLNFVAKAKLTFSQPGFILYNFFREK